MIFDEVHDIYLPCYYALMSSKSESCYRMTFKAMMEDLGGKFDPATIGKSAASFGVPSFVLY